METESIRCDKFDKLEREFKNSKNKSFVGEGAFSEVYEGYYSQPLENVPRNDSLFERLNFLGQASRTTVVKKRTVAKFVKYNNIDEQKYIINEILMLHKMSHPNVVEVYAYAHKPLKKGGDAGEFIIILEHGGQNLAQFLKNKNSKTLPKWEIATILDIAIQILKGLEYLHMFDKEEKFIHRDIKPENIFIQCNENKTGYIVKLGDFGHIRNTGGENTNTNKSIQGTLRYMAFEVFKAYVDNIGLNKPGDASVYSQSIDIFAVGLTIMYMITKMRPFAHTVRIYILGLFEMDF